MQAPPPPAVTLSADVPPDFNVARIQSDKALETPRIRIDCPQSSSGEIVVCGRGTAGRDRLAPLPFVPVDPTFTERAARLMTLHLGPIEIGTPCSGGKCWVGLKIIF